MRPKIFIFFLLPVLFACKKETLTILPEPVAPPEMLYKDLQNRAVRYGQAKTLDLDNDGAFDLVFGVQLVGDPVLVRDRWQFLVNSGVNRNLLVNNDEQTPVLEKKSPIKSLMPGYTWYEIGSIVLAEKIVTNDGQWWEGTWKSVHHQFLPVQLIRESKRFHGWVELSFDMVTETLTLHRSAISKEAEKEVLAGQ